MYPLNKHVDSRGTLYEQATISILNPVIQDQTGINRLWSDGFSKDGKQSIPLDM